MYKADSLATCLLLLEKKKKKKKYIYIYMYIYVLHFRGSRWSEKKAMLVSALDKSSSVTRVDVTWHDNDMFENDVTQFALTNNF